MEDLMQKNGASENDLAVQKVDSLKHNGRTIFLKNCWNLQGRGVEYEIQ